MIGENDPDMPHKDRAPVPDVAGRDIAAAAGGRVRLVESYSEQEEKGLGNDKRMDWSTGRHVAVNPKDLIGDTKVAVHLVPPALVLHAAEALKLGAEKYGPYNWRQYPIQAHAYYAALLRHLTAWWDGEDDDPESGASHLSHAAAGLAILLDAMSSGTLKDDRPATGPAGAIIRGKAA